jgi:dTDP-glucose 4,6-dehydratase
MKVLVTGGAGFIGSNLVHYLVKNYPSWKVIVLDALTYAGNPENLLPVKDKIEFIKGDICDEQVVDDIMKRGIDIVFHLAAESHVDRSIYEPPKFLRTNVFGTYNLLEIARKRGVGVFVHVSTDEVYGSIKKGFFTEKSPMNPSSPYSASKAGGDLIAQAYWRMFGVPVIIVRPSNNYGPYQYPEKFIPLCITNALEDKPIPIYGKGLNVRDWLYVEDCAEGLVLCALRGKKGQIYNMGAGQEKRNIDVAKTILKKLGKPLKLIAFVKDRPAHDFRYAMKSEKIKKEVKFKPKTKFEEGIEKTIKWYIENQNIWRKIKNSPEFEEHKRRIYGDLF